MKKLLVFVTAVFVFTALPYAQGAIAGKWQGQTKSGTPIGLDLAVKGTALTGTFTRGEQTIAITDGKVSKNTFTFKATIGEQVEAFTGELSGEQLNVWLDRQGASSAAVLKRVKT